MDTLTFWSHVTKLLDDGFSVIPIRDKEETIGDKVFTKKSSYGKWEKYQKQIATKEELWFLLEKYNTQWIATVCGKVSGNLEGIDIDEKYLPGISRLLLNALKQSLPDLFSRLRIIKTPSEGYHILYRVSDGVVPPSKKLCFRLATEEELKENPKGKTKCFVESRGENGYVVAAPTEGYIAVQDVPVPVITWDERMSIMSICLSFNQVIKDDVYKPTKQENIYYSENPFEHFNKSNDAEQVLLNNGWVYHSENSKAINFTRPGSKTGGIHASFLKESKLYIFFTTNCEFENDRLYSGSTVMAKLQFGDDKKRLFVELVKKGYGKIRANKEYEIVKKAAISGGELPANVSNTAKEYLGELKEGIQKTMPFGIFWEFNEYSKIVINRENLYTVANGLGFRYYKESLHQIIDCFVYERTERYFYDVLKEYIKDEDGDLLNQIYNAYEAYIEKHGEFSIERLCLIEEKEFLKDSRDVCYKFYANGFLKIDKKEIKYHLYSDLKTLGLVLFSRVQQRNFEFGQITGKYIEFISLACNYEKNSEYIKRVVGFLSHEYKDESTGYIIVQTEECPDPKQGGGSGKNIFVNLLKNTTTVHTKPGAQTKFDEKFLQSWRGERILNISDVPKKFNFEFLKDLSTGEGIQKKLYVDEKGISVEDMCKFVVSTNFSYEVTDGGLARRIKPIEFTDFFTKCKGVDVYFGCQFPKGWSKEDWIGFDNFIVNSVQSWLQADLKIEPLQLSEGGFIKQFDQTYPEIRGFIEKHFDQWIADGYVYNEDFKRLWIDYCEDSNIKEMYRPKVEKLNNALSDWCKERGWVFKKDMTRRDEIGNVRRVKEFCAPF